MFSLQQEGLNSNPGQTKDFLCGFYMFSLCLGRFPQGQNLCLALPSGPQNKTKPQMHSTQLFSLTYRKIMHNYLLQKVCPYLLSILRFPWSLGPLLTRIMVYLKPHCGTLQIFMLLCHMSNSNMLQRCSWRSARHNNAIIAADGAFGREANVFKPVVKANVAEDELVMQS